MIGLYAFAALFIGVPGLVYLADWRHRRRTAAEMEDEAVRAAQAGSEGPGAHEPVAPALPPTFLGPPGGF
jgi:hypothetical protein